MNILYHHYIPTTPEVKHIQKISLVNVENKNCCHLFKDRHKEILKYLLQFENLFVGTFWEFHTGLIYFDLKEGAVPKHHSPSRVVKI